MSKMVINILKNINFEEPMRILNMKLEGLVLEPSIFFFGGGGGG